MVQCDHAFHLLEGVVKRVRVHQRAAEATSWHEVASGQGQEKSQTHRCLTDVTWLPRKPWHSQEAEAFLVRPNITAKSQYFALLLLSVTCLPVGS